MAALTSEQVGALVALIDGAPSATAAAEALKTLSTVLNNADNPTKRTLKMSNPGLQKRILNLPSGRELLVSLGFLANESAGLLLWDEALPDGAGADRGAAIAAALAALDGIVGAITVVGDSNAPSVAQEALKLTTTYVGNVAADESEARRRIGVTNKALNTRLLNATGGAALLAASGFVAEANGGETEAYVFAHDTSMARVSHAALQKAPAVWSALAAASDNGGGQGGDSSGSGGPKVTADEPSVAVDKINIRTLPTKASVLARTCRADMQPAVCKSDDGAHVHLYTYQCASRRWTLAGSMPIPSTDFTWATPGKLVIEVDLGDAHGTGKPVEVRLVALVASPSPSQLVASL